MTRRHGPASQDPPLPSSASPPPAGEEAPSVYERALGDEIGRLNPRLRPYFGSIPDGYEGVGVGVYEEAGLRVHALRPLFALLGRWHIAFPDHGREIPFTVRNTRATDGVQHAERTFVFPAGTRMMVDAMHVRNRRLVDRVGTGGRIEVEFSVSTFHGTLRMESRRLGVHVAGVRVPIPPVVRITLREDCPEGEDDRQRVDVRMTVPILGEVYGYRGRFSYTLRPVQR